MEIIEKLKNYQPYNEQEARDKEELLKLLEMDSQIFYREQKQYHITVSAWVVNKEKTKALMAYHNIYHSWSWLGGHADGNTNLLEVAIKEVQEESGVTYVKPLSEEIFSIEILTVDGHEKRGEYVPSHLHLNITFLLEADDTEAVMIKEDENSQVGWFSLEEAVEASTEEWFKERIYDKLNKKLSGWRR